MIRPFPPLLLLLSALFLTGCGSSRVQVAKANESGQRFAAADIREDTTGTGLVVEDKQRRSFEDRLKDRLFGDGSFARGRGLVVTYRFRDGDEGSRSGRYFLGFGAGAGNVVIEAEFFDSTGTKLAAINAVGTVSGGAFGGSYSEAFERAADEIATYARKQFLGK